MKLSLYSISYIFVFISSFAMACIMFFKKREQNANFVWGLFCLNTLFYSIGGFLSAIADSERSAFWGLQIQYVGVVGAPLLFFHFVCSYLEIKNKKNIVRSAYVFALAFLYFIFFKKQLFFGQLSFMFNEFYSIDWMIDRSIPFLIFYVLFYWVLLIYGYFLLLQKYFQTREKRIHYKYLIFGLGIGWVGAHGLFLSHFGIDLYPFSNFLIAIYPIIVGYAIIKHNLLGLNIVFKKGLVYSIFLGILTACYLLFISILGEFFKGLLGYQSFIINLFALFVFGLMFNPLRNWIQRILDKRFFNGTLESLDQERQRLQQELFQTEKLAYVGQLASSVVHEIRNPLTAIKTYIEYHPKKYMDEEYRLKFQHILPREIKRIENVVNHLLDLAKPRNLVFRDVSLSQVINETLTLLEESLSLKKIQVEKHFEVKDDIVIADFDQLKQVCLNLFLNSIQAMEEGGVLSIMIDNGLKTLVCVTIRDSGAGIPAEQIKTLFTPFATTKEDGIGLGLVITKEIIDAHQGKISVESEEGKGTVFIIEFPGKQP